MLAVVFKFLDSFAPWSYVALAFVAMVAYDRMIDDPAVAAKARAGYVEQARHAALEGELLETKRQWAAALSTAASWHAQLLKEQADQARQDALDAASTEQYRAQIDEATRNCRKLTQRDLDYLNGVQHKP